MSIRHIFGKNPHDIETYNIPCQDPEKHQEYTYQEEWDAVCWYCHSKWYESLPWVRSSLETLRYDDDKALMSLLRVADDIQKKKRLTVVYRNCWEHLDADHQNYISELFGIEIGESKDPDSYPYWRLTKKASPNLIIPIIRHRICYEPQMKEYPIYLEIVYTGFHREINMHGFDSVEDLSMSDLKYLLRALDWLHDKDGKDNTELWGTAKNKHGGARYIKAANLPEDVKRALGKRYIELRDSLTNVKKDAKTALEYVGNDWRNRILNKYPILENHPDLIEEINPYKPPNDAEASDAERAPWEIAIEIAARETIPDYTPRRVSGETLKKHAIFPDKENE